MLGKVHFYIILYVRQYDKFAKSLLFIFYLFSISLKLPIKIKMCNYVQEYITI